MAYESIIQRHFDHRLQGVRNGSEWLSGINRNRCPACFGMSVRNASEYALKSFVETKATEVVKKLGSPGPKNALYKVTVAFYQKTDRWLQHDIPRQDQGIDLDNLLKKVFDGLDPIIGYRKSHKGSREYSGVLDSSIIEVCAKKINSGSDKEFLGVEVEIIHEPKK